MLLELKGREDEHLSQRITTWKEDSCSGNRNLHSSCSIAIYTSIYLSIYEITNTSYYIHIYISDYTYNYKYIRLYMYIFQFIYIHTYICVCVCVYIYIYIYI